MLGISGQEMSEIRGSYSECVDEKVAPEDGRKENHGDAVRFVDLDLTDIEVGDGYILQPDGLREVLLRFLGS